jgi:hypothetical protein
MHMPTYAGATADTTQRRVPQIPNTDKGHNTWLPHMQLSLHSRQLLTPPHPKTLAVEGMRCQWRDKARQQLQHLQQLIFAVFSRLLSR